MTRAIVGSSAMLLGSWLTAHTSLTSDIPAFWWLLSAGLGVAGFALAAIAVFDWAAPRGP